MKIKPVLIFIIVISAYFIPQCNMYDVVAPLSDDDLRWVNNFKLDDTIFFNSNVGNRDTLIVTDKRINNSKNIFKSTFNLNSYNLGNANVDFYIIHKQKKFDCEFRIVKGEDKETNYFYWELGPFQSDEDYHILFGHKVKLSIIKVNNLPLQECVIGDTGNSHWNKPLHESDSCFLVNQVLFSKDYGLLEYRIGDEMYRRVDVFQEQ